MQKAGSAVDADTSFRAAARTSPGVVRDLPEADCQAVRGSVASRDVERPRFVALPAQTEVLARVDEILVGSAEQV
jgi:hypothetical protein